MCYLKKLSIWLCLAYTVSNATFYAIVYIVGY